MRPESHLQLSGEDSRAFSPTVAYTLDAWSFRTWGTQLISACSGVSTTIDDSLSEAKGLWAWRGFAIFNS